MPEDYVFQGVRAHDAHADVRLSELFADGKDSLFVYNFMFGPDMEAPCPSCSAFLDSLDGAVRHAEQRINVAIVARSPLPRILAAVEERGWRHLRFLSSAGNTYNRDYFGGSEDGDQLPMSNVFHRAGNTIRHVSGAELMFAESDPGQDSRHHGTLDLFQNLFDLTPDGRGDFNPSLAYESDRAGNNLVD